jgi:hypothetical protein
MRSMNGYICNTESKFLLEDNLELYSAKQHGDSGFFREVEK